MATPRSGRPRKGEELARRDRLLRQAFLLFAEHGYGSLSLETIAREARVSLRTIYRQFGGKAELFGAVIRQCSDLFVAVLPQEGEAEASLEEVLIEFGKHFLYRVTRPECVRLRSQIMAEAQRFPEFAAEFHRHGPARTLDGLARFFALQQKKGKVTIQDPTFLAGQFLSALRGDKFQRIQLGLEGAPSDDEIEQWVRRAVHLFLHGCLVSLLN
jgi:AcrR family transcriptional regulator